MRFGYHVGVNGPPVSAILNGMDAGCETIQMFPGSPQQWGTPVASDDEVGEFVAAKKTAGIDPVVLHSIYLVNMAAPSKPIFSRSIASLASALEKADRLGADYVVTHIGNHKGEGEDFGLTRIAEAVTSCFERNQGKAVLLLETTAGAGTSIGNTFEQLGAVFDRAGRPERLGFCLDTCHVFAAGYDLRTTDGIDGMLDEMDAFIGLDRLRAIHMNDTVGELGSHLDRHAHIGRGKIGLDSFAYMVNHPSLAHLPAIVEISHEEPDAPDDLEVLRSLVNR